MKMMKPNNTCFLVLVVIILNSPLLTIADSVPVDLDDACVTEDSSTIYFSLGGVLGLLVLIGCCVCICRVCCGCCRRDTHVIVVNAAPTSRRCTPVVIAPTIVNST